MDDVRKRIPAITKANHLLRTQNSILPYEQLMATGVVDRQELPPLENLLSRHGYESKDLDRKYPAEMRLEIAQLLHDWKMMGYYLGFTPQKLNDIKIDNESEEQRRVALLDAWEQREGEGTTYLKLAEALHHRGRADLVENLCGMIRRVREEMETIFHTQGVKSCKLLVADTVLHCFGS